MSSEAPGPAPSHIPDELIAREHFVYFGLAENVLFFIRVVYAARDPDLVTRSCGDVYNCLIHETYLRRGQTAVVYNVYFAPPAGTPAIHPVYVWHTLFPRMKFTQSALEKMLKRLLAAEREPGEKSLVITAHYEGGVPHHYTGAEVPDVASLALPAIPSFTELAPLASMLSTKPVGHLAAPALTPVPAQQ